MYDEKMSWINVTDYSYPNGWTKAFETESRAAEYCRRLEAGRILFFENIPFDLPKEHQEFLLSQRQTDSRLHKNISYRPNKNILRGASSSAERDEMRRVMQNYSREVTRFVSEFLAPYKNNLSLDYASFRPLEEDGRDLPLHKRNDLLHVDAFPSRPTRGGRILRVFTNINPNDVRVWNVAEPFDVLAENLAREAGLNEIVERASSAPQNFLRGTMRSMRSIGIPVAERSPYDKFMLRFHDFLKENSRYQTECAKTRLEFPPLSTWIVYTDGVPHAALSGQFALEHTYIVPLGALVSADKAPIRILEKMCSQSLS